MKKIIYTIGALLLISSVQAQQAGTITNPPNGGTTHYFPFCKGG